jgi:glycosyltransferase involved in cell wall biosynthesis
VLGRQLADRVVRIPERIVVVRNGVATEMLRPASAADTLRADLGLEPDARVIGTVGRFDPIKAYDVLLDAFRLLRVSWLSDSPQPVLVLAGDGPERERLESLARDLGIGDSVRFVGWRDDVPALLAAFDVFTLSSKSEGTSVSLLEAMSMGVCPVVTAVGGNPAVLGDELAHRLVPSGDAQAMADAWVAAFSDEAARRADGMKGRSRVERFYSLDRMVRKYERLYLGEPLEPAYAGATGVERGGR